MFAEKALETDTKLLSLYCDGYADVAAVQSGMVSGVAWGKAEIQAFFGKASRKLMRCLERLGIWGVALGVALYPALDAAGVSPQEPHRWALAINQAGFFRDLFFVSIAMVVVSVSNLWDNIVRKFGTVNIVSKGIVTLAFCYYILFILYGGSHYKNIATGAPGVDAALFETDWSVGVYTVLFATFVEVVIALED